MFGRVVHFWKTHEQEILTVVIIIAASLASFGLGYLSAQDTSRAPIIIEKNSE